MKTVLVVVATTACLWSLAGRAADKLANSEVPDAVRAAVSKAYPDAASCVFERERRGAAVQYEAEFESRRETRRGDSASKFRHRVSSSPRKSSSASRNFRRLSKRRTARPASAKPR